MTEIETVLSFIAVLVICAILAGLFAKVGSRLVSARRANAGTFFGRQGNNVNAAQRRGVWLLVAVIVGISILSLIGAIFL